MRVSLKKKITILLLFLTNLNLFCQQGDLFSLSVLDKSAINPAYVGSKNGITSFVFLRQAFQGVDKAPTNALVGASMPLDILRGGIGLRFNIDQVGFETKNSVFLEYSYKLNINQKKNHFARFGLGLGLVQQDLDVSSLKFREETSPNRESSAKMGFDSRFGVSYQYGWFNAGLMVDNINEPTLDLSSKSESLSYKFKREYIINASFTHKIEDGFKISPSIFYVENFSTRFLYLNLMLDIYDKFYGAIGYRNEAANLMVGMNLKYGIGFFVSYDLYMNEIGRKANSYEAGIRYIFELGKNTNKKIRVNRFL